VVSQIVVASFRLGETDGVSIEAAKWIDALQLSGHDVTTVAGEGHADVLIPGLAMHAKHPACLEEVTSAFEQCDIAIIENIASLPLNVAARDVLYQVLDGRETIFHHHDLPWQQSQYAHLDGPRDQARWHHVTINELSRRELAQRGIAATTIMNSFDCDPPCGGRERTREALSVGNQQLLLMPTRAIARKNVEGALALASSLDAVLWLLGPSEDGYDAQLNQILSNTNVEVRRGFVNAESVHDAYAACDLVVVPSTWEGFGNPVLESVTHRRPLAVFPYPVLHEIESFGFEFFHLDEPQRIAQYLHSPDEGLLERNLLIAREHFNVTNLPSRLAQLINSDESDVRESVATTRLT
jgi:glycosyltransferase involved in cell wall biosynthesis